MRPPPAGPGVVDDARSGHASDGPAPPRYRLFGSYRFLLAVAVVVSHSWTLSYAGTTTDLLPNIGLGDVAVMGFFVLSGFVIAEALATFYQHRPWAFLANRFVRLAPPYWVALALSLVVHATIASWVGLKLLDYQTPPAGMFDPANLLANLIAIFPRPGRFNITPELGFYGFVRFYWAIYIEFAFYIAAFVVVLGVNILARKSARRAGLLVSLGAAGGLVLHAIHEYVHPIHWELAYAPYFVLGVCFFAWLVRRQRLALGGAAFAYLFVFLHFARYAQGKLEPSDNWISGLAEANVAAALVLMLLTPLSLLLLARLEPSRRMREWDRRLGDLSYPIYLNHYAVLIAFHSLVSNKSFLWQMVAVVTSVLVSWLLMIAVERPIAPLRNRLRGQAVRV
jgi:peptidoglycan/LPS O-acetylase OafA/YrhL